jgi:PAS domain S-box-containing protein
MEQENNSKKDINLLAGELRVYEDALRDASFQIEEKVQELSILRRVVDIAGHVFELDVFYRSFVDILMEETSAMNCSLMVMDNYADRLILKIARGRNDDGTFIDYPVDSKIYFSLGKGVAGNVALSRETVLVNDTSKDNRFELRETRFPVESLLCSPLVFQKKVLGVVNISHTQPNAFNENSKRLMEILCGFVSNIIGNAMVHIKNQQRFRSMFEGIPFSIIIIDPDRRKIIDCNPYTEKCFGYSKKELIQIEDVSAIVPSEYREELVSVLYSSTDQDNEEFYEIPFLQKDGSLKICEINAGLISYLEKSVIRLTLNDISEKKKLTERLVQAEKLRSLGELAGGVAHDFNNILAAIIGGVQLLRMCKRSLSSGTVDRKMIDMDLERNMNIIEKAALDGAETVRRIQEFSRGQDDNKYSLPVDLNRIVEDALEFTRVRWKDMVESKGKEIKLRKNFGSLEPVSGNASELREVFINLINNAVDAMPNGGELEVKTFMDEGFVVVDVKDTGIGISDDVREKIFDPFFTTKDLRSTGFGLSVSCGIVGRHKGKIKVDSIEGYGTCFTIKLPVCKKKVEEEKIETDFAEQKKAKILVVEDEKDIGEVLCNILMFSGHEVDFVDNGSDGIKKFREKEFNLVITDLGMPGISGFDVAKEIKEISCNTPVILITGWGIQLNKHELREYGVDLVINKPFQMQKVLSMIQDVISLE